MVYYQKLLKDSIEVWCPSFPRQCFKQMNNPQGWGQVTVHSTSEIVSNMEALRGEGPGFVSVYSFPDGHTSENGENVPLIDTLMFDLDIRQSANGSTAVWERYVSDLLKRTRTVAQTLLDTNRAKYWRASLSGHKGVHLYLDFPALNHREGSAMQFENGLKSYTEDLLESIQSETELTDLNEYVDVMSGKDFARLTRLPNTVHDKATARFGETRFCVPVTIEELAEITIADYIDLTKHPRPVPDSCRRIESDQVHDVLIQEIREANTSAGYDGSYTSGNRNPSRIEHYKNEVANENVDLDILKIHLRNCCWRFHFRDDKFAYGSQSHTMELNCIAEMVDKGAPIDVMIKFFAGSENFDEDYTRTKIHDVISYDYSPFKTDNLRSEAPEFFKD